MVRKRRAPNKKKVYKDLVGDALLFIKRLLKLSDIPTIHSITGAGVPMAMQSIFPPVSFEKWSRVGGS